LTTGAPIDLFAQVPECWKPYFDQSKLNHVGAFLARESKARHGWQPKQIFRPLELTKPNEFSVCHIGQDPYPKAGVPTGLPFSVSKGTPCSKWPASLKAIFKELVCDWPGQQACPASGCLEQWTKFCLLWNVTPTCEVPQSTRPRRGRGTGRKRGKTHRSCGWHDVTRHLIREIVRHNAAMVFICWGDDAKRFVIGSPVGTPQYPVIASNHPSRRSHGQGTLFLCSRPFSQACSYAKKLGLRDVDWTL